MDVGSALSLLSCASLDARQDAICYVLLTRLSFNLEAQKPESTRLLVRVEARTRCSGPAKHTLTRTFREPVPLTPTTFT